jgi:transcription initiation factor TFIID TATA-box-binding protein
MDVKKASYEPEQFPALVYKDWNVSFLLFSSGKVILAGAKTFEQAEESLKLFKDYIDTIY